MPDNDIQAILTNKLNADLDDDDMVALLIILRDNPHALVDEIRRQQDRRLAAVADDLVAIVTDLIRQRDALLRIADSAEKVLADLPGLLDTYAGDHLARQIETLNDELTRIKPRRTP